MLTDLNIKLATVCYSMRPWLFVGNMLLFVRALTFFEVAVTHAFHPLSIRCAFDKAPILIPITEHLAVNTPFLMTHLRTRIPLFLSVIGTIQRVVWGS